MKRSSYFSWAATAALVASIVTAGSGGCATGSSEFPGDLSSTATSGTGGKGAGGHGGAASSSTGKGGAATTGVGGMGGMGGMGGAAPECGNGKKEPGEECDGIDFGGKTCKDYGLDGGDLTCNQFCNVTVDNCTPPEDCNNGIDDNNDSLIDCDDPECKNDAGCKDPCASPIAVMNGDFDFNDTTGRPNVLKPSCTASSGNERVYTFTAAADDTLELLLTGNDADFSLSVRTNCNDAKTELKCVNNGGEFASETLSLKVKKGQKYSIIVDGTNPAEFGFYELDVSEYGDEQNCSDYTDNDFDNLVDCADPSNCQMLADCKPGKGAPGTKCTQHSDCAATGNDPLCIDDNYYGWPGGYCSEYCTVAKNDCPAGSVCADVVPLGMLFDWKNGFGACLKTCAKKADCPTGYMCADFGAGFVCRP